MDLHCFSKKSPQNGRQGSESTNAQKTSNKDSNNSGNPEESGKQTKRVFERYAEKCTMHGPSHIHGAKSWPSRLLWIAITLTCLILLLYYVITLFQLYLSYPVTQTLAMNFAPLQFPAVTVCSVNPVRASMLKDMSFDLKKFLNRVDPTTVGSVIDNLPGGANSSSTPTPNNNNDNNQQLNDIDLGYSDSHYDKARGPVDDSAYDGLNGYEESWESEGQTSTLAQMEQMFRALYAAENSASRESVGHQMTDMLLSCSFAGKSCYAHNFTHSSSTALGNCYTLQYRKFISKTSGPDGGLELVLFLDMDESLRGIAPGDGLQVSVQPQGTVPFPLQQGVAVDAGSHTMIAIQLVEVQRNGPPYGYCADDTQYLKRYRMRYSKQVCHKFCEHEELHRSCQCRDETEDYVNKLMNVTSLRPCRTTADMVCLFRAQWRYQNGGVQCTCYDRCFETRYNRVASSRSWPHESYAENVLVKFACRRLSADKCRQLKNKDPKIVKREFVKINVFFEDLNYQKVSDVADYTAAKYIADVGGNLALWLGLSLVSLMEILQLMVELTRHCCWRRCGGRGDRGDRHT